MGGRRAVGGRRRARHLAAPGVGSGGGSCAHGNPGTQQTVARPSCPTVARNPRQHGQPGNGRTGFSIKAYGLQRMLQHALQRMLQHMLQHPVLQRVLQHVLQSALQHALQRPVLQHALEHALQSALQHALQSALQHALQHPVLQHALQSALKSLFSLDFSF